MNIQEAKQEIINTVKTYLRRDETGSYEIPVEKQRPLLLIGPPGIGKTAIMEQVAAECGIGLVSYTITHHTRQSAIGLPYISERHYDGRPFRVTEYTMSEIIASVYDRIERSGIREGILFLDEINCVSETLAPTMLQFLQYKTFGSHRVPDGFIIVTAGNPPQYNKSVRDLDIVTLDRVRRIDIEEDFAAWKTYAREAGVHGSILAYLDIRNDHFYSIRTEIEERYFVTARGWEDLSRMITVCEEEEIPVTAALCGEYLQDPEIASSFASYYELYRKYRTLYRVPDILEGIVPEETAELRNAPFDEKLSLIGLLTDSLSQELRLWHRDRQVAGRVLDAVRGARSALRQLEDENAPSGAGAAETADTFLASARQELAAEAARLRDSGAGDRRREEVLHHTAKALGEAQDVLRSDPDAQTMDPRAVYSILKCWFDTREDGRAAREAEADRHMGNCFSFMAATFGEGQEMVLFLSELTGGYYTIRFLADHGNTAYDRYNKLLLLRDRRSALRAEILS